MKSFISFFLWFNLNCPSVVIIRDENRGIVDECPLDRTADFPPRVLFVVKLVSYDKYDYFVNVYSNVSFLFNPLQISRVAGCLHF